MCSFFSFVTNSKGDKFYLNYEQSKELRFDDVDSHSVIVDYYQRKGVLSGKQGLIDKFNKYEYNPLTGEFTVDQINTEDDSKRAEKWVRKLDFKDIVPELIIKPIINPLTDIHGKRLTQKDKDSLVKWDSVWAIVGDSAWAIVRDSVRASAGDSVWDSVWSSFCAYVSSFLSLQDWKYIEHSPGENPFQPCIDLWERGFVPSYKGKVWRLHKGKEAKVVYEWKGE